MNSENGGQSSSDLQRQAAAALARKKVLAAYAESAKKAAKEVGVDNARMKDEPVTTKINSESWKKYHSAWQDYYQRYYSEYYSKAAQNYVAKERLKDTREKAEEEEILSSLTRSSAKLGKKGGLSLGTGEIADGSVQEASDVDIIKSRLRRHIRKKATESAKNTPRKRHLMPSLAGVA